MKILKDDISLEMGAMKAEIQNLKDKVNKLESKQNDNDCKVIVKYLWCSWNHLQIWTCEIALKQD